MSYESWYTRQSPDQIISRLFPLVLGLTRSTIMFFLKAELGYFAGNPGFTLGTAKNTGRRCRLARMLPFAFRELSWAVFRFSRVVHIYCQFWGRHDFALKKFRDPLFLHPVLTNIILDPPEETDWLRTPEKKREILLYKSSGKTAGSLLRILPVGVFDE